MKKWLAVWLGLLAHPAIAQVKESICAEFLVASTLETGLSPDGLREYFRLGDRETLVQSIPDVTHTLGRLSPGVAMVHYKIRVDEISLSTGQSRERLTIDCPIVKDWTLDVLPKLLFRKWSGLRDQTDPDQLGQAKTLIRSGLKIVKFFHDSEQYYSISLLWDLSSLGSDERVNLPSFVNRSQVRRNVLSLDSSRVAAKALRMSTTGKFGNVWFLLTPEALKRVGNLEMLSALSPETAQSIEVGTLGRGSASIDFLDYYDTLNKRFYPCHHLLAKVKDLNCFYFNSVLYPDLLRQMEESKKIWVQVILKLDKGYLIQTYVLGDQADEEPSLIEQSYELELSKFGISSDLLF